MYNTFGNQYTITSVCSMRSNEQNASICLRSFVNENVIENAEELNQNNETSNSNNVIIMSSILRPIDENVHLMFNPLLKTKSKMVHYIHYGGRLQNLSRCILNFELKN